MKHLKLSLCSAIVVAAAAITTPAVGQTEVWDQCRKTDFGARDERIAACSKLIESRGVSREQKAIAYLNRGAASEAKMVRDQAIADYSEAIKLDPKFAEAYARRAAARHFADVYSPAPPLADYDEAIRLDPTKPRYYFERGSIYKDSTSLPLNLEAKAIGDNIIRETMNSKDVIRRQKEDPEYRNRQGKALDEAQARAAAFKYEKALADFTAAIRLDPAYSRAFRARAELFRDAKLYDLAIADYEKAIQLSSSEKRHPLFAPPEIGDYQARADIYKAKGDHASRVRDLTKVIELKPKDYDAYVARGDAYRDSAQDELAIADYSEAIRITPDPRAYVSRGNLYEKKHDYQRAISDYSQTIDHPASTLYRARAYYRKGDYASASKAIKDLATYKDSIIDKRDVNRVAGYLQFVLGNFKEAAEYLSDTNPDPDRMHGANEAGQRATRLLGQVTGDKAGVDPIPAVVAYDKLWAAVAGARAGIDPQMKVIGVLGVEQKGVRDLMDYWKESRANKKTDWPHPLVSLYLGAADPQTTLRVAKTAEDRCQAHFFIGQWQLIKKDSAAATQSTREAIRACAPATDEHKAAQAELKRPQPASQKK